MLPAKRKRTHPDVTDLLAIASHANNIDMMQVCVSPAYRTLFAHETGVYVPLNILAVLDQRDTRRDIILDDELYEEVDELPCRGHIAVGKREQPPLHAFHAGKHKLHLECPLGTLDRPCVPDAVDVLCNLADQRVHLASLFWRDAPSVGQDDFYLAIVPQKSPIEVGEGGVYDRRPVL